MTYRTSDAELVRLRDEATSFRRGHFDPDVDWPEFETVESICEELLRARSALAEVGELGATARMAQRVLNEARKAWNDWDEHAKLTELGALLARLSVELDALIAKRDALIAKRDTPVVKFGARGAGKEGV